MTCLNPVHHAGEMGAVGRTEGTWHKIGGEGDRGGHWGHEARQGPETVGIPKGSHSHPCMGLYVLDWSWERYFRLTFKPEPRALMKVEEPKVMRL